MNISSPSSLASTPIRVSITVYNDSDRPGKEVVQLYMRDPVASVVRPVQQLIGFRKVAFAPWEEKEIEFTLTEPMLRFWNFDMKHVSEPGEIRLMIGCADHFVLTDEIIMK